MELSEMNLLFNTSTYKSVEIPLNCPYCGKAVEFSFRQCTGLALESNRVFYTNLLHAKCCSKNLIVSHLLEDNEYKFLSMYPNPKPSVLPDSIINLSPRFVTLYADSEIAYSKNMIELAGSGFRNALEILIKDYAINELGNDPQEVSNMKLFNAIDKYLPDEKLKKSADVVRILGNDYTHYDRKYSQYDINILKVYLDIFIRRIDVDYLMSHPPVSRH